MSHNDASPAPAATDRQPEAYVLSLLSAGRFEAALQVVAELGDGRAYWPDFHNHAQRLLVAGRVAEAATALEAAAGLDPERPENHEAAGELCLRQGRWAAAVEAFQRAVAMNPKSAAGRYGLGRALRQLGKRRQALESLVAALEANPRPEWVAELQKALRTGSSAPPRHKRGHREGDPLSQRAQQAIARATAVTAGANTPTLSVCMIVRDEEDTLGRCLQSARRLADEIVVVDTGSQDQTIAVAERFGAVVHHYAWGDDFAAAKNEALRHATSDWVLVLDADDELGDPAGLKAYLATAQDVNVCALRTRIPHRGQVGETVVEHPRLFRNYMGYHYRGPVHEQLCEIEGSPAAADASLDLVVYHHGYLEAEAEQGRRHERNLRILLAWVERAPSDAWAQFCLGQTYYTNREMEAAIPPLIAALEHAAADRAYRPKAYSYLASAYTATGGHEQAERTCRSGLEDFPDQAELLFGLGHALERQQRFDDAIAAYEAATRGRFGAMLAFHDFTCRDIKPLARLAEIHAARGEFDEALTCCERIERVRGAQPAVRALRSRIASARRLRDHTRVAENALTDARAAVAAHPDDVGWRIRLAASLFAAGDAAEAEQHASVALEQDPASPQGLNLKGVLLCARGERGAAIEHFQRAVALRPDYADALCNLGAARLNANDTERAEKAFTQAAAADETCYAAHFALGELAQARGDNDRAAVSYQSAIKADAAAPGGWLGLARSYLAVNAYDAAAQCYAKAAEVAGPDPQIMAEIEQMRARLVGLKTAGANSGGPALS